ncbi:DNA replication and repair protein RecF [Alicyclobacillus contaminans]|uniref:DNA replication/repair protein RecF n=1 Tax=Alicyclobacillus contaminans TaxID=392016 RepID=UPI0004170F18|nr:DNA replication/repair protein RecF [Alicyclobacillus contaminans]GMA50738.1 DNA replication and repair protein RecF [Alicyclobacillus contaminans]
MHVQSLTLTNYRNYETLHIAFSPSVNVFVGENAQGKTNALEAIYFLAMGKSHRTHRDADCIRWNCSDAQIQSEVFVHGKVRRLQIDFHQGAKRASVNGVNQAKMTDFVGQFQVVLFAPEDLQLVKGGPQGRRRFIDMELGQTYPKYLYHLSQYQRALQQRNSLLKNMLPNASALLDVLDAQLVEHGSEVLLRRLRFLDRMKQLAADIYTSISDGREELALDYACSVAPMTDSEPPDKSRIQSLFSAALERRRSADMQAGHTTVGPHRDDLLFTLNGQPVQSFASQGQQRTIALSLRLAEIDLIQQEVGEYPVLLLDDVLSELDDIRQRNLVFNMSQKVQTIVTTTSLFQLRDKLQADVRLFQVRSGIIQNEG